MKRQSSLPETSRRPITGRALLLPIVIALIGSLTVKAVLSSTWFGIGGIAYDLMRLSPRWQPLSNSGDVLLAENRSSHLHQEADHPQHRSYPFVSVLARESLVHGRVEKMGSVPDLSISPM